MSPHIGMNVVVGECHSTADDLVEWGKVSCSPSSKSLSHLRHSLFQSSLAFDPGSFPNTQVVPAEINGEKPGQDEGGTEHKERIEGSTNYCSGVAAVWWSYQGGSCSRAGPVQDLTDVFRLAWSSKTVACRGQWA